MIGQKFGHYRIIEQIGAGGMGVVYRAHDEQLERDVAVKILRPGTLGDEAARKRFRKEALSLAKLNHPGIATVHEFNSQDGTDFLVTEYIAGITLDSKLAGGMLPAEEVIGLGLQLSQGLAAAHAQGIVHRDLKPGNLRLTPDGRLKILDFGLAQLMPHASDLGLTATLTESQEVTGTLPYMAPEQLSGKPADARTDIWATGAVLYEMATGKRPFPESNGPLLINSILNQKPEPPSKLNKEVSSGLENVIAKALEKNPANRYQTAREVGIALESLKTSTASFGVERGGLPRPLAIAGIMAVLGALILGGFLLVRRSNKTESTAVPAVKHRRSVAVLGFKNLAGKPDEAWLSTAISEMLTTNLAAGEELRLVPGETVAQMKNNLALPDAESYAQETLDKIRKQTSADDVVIGSYLALGSAADGKVQLDLKLQEAQAGETIVAFSEEGKEAELMDLVTRAGARLREKLGAGDIAPDDLAAVKAATPATTEAIRLYSEGLAKQRAYDDRAALDLLQKAVVADPNYALAHSALSEAWFGVGHHMQGMEEAQRAFELSANLSKEDRLWVEAEYREANGEAQKAFEIYKTLFDLHPDNLEYGLRLARSQDGVGKSQEALATLELLRKLPPSERDDPRIDLHEGYAAWSLSNWQRAEEAIRRALKKATDSGARLIVAQALNQEGDLDESQGKADQALDALERAMNIYSEVGDQDSRASVLNRVAGLLSETGDLAGADKMYREALDIHTKASNERMMLFDSNNLAHVNFRQGNLKDAMENNQRALTMSRRQSLKPLEISSLMSIGSVLARQGDPRGARQFYEKSLAEYRASKDPQNWFCLCFFADKFADQGDLAKAQSLLQENVDRAAKSENEGDMANALREFADLMVKKAELTDARAKYEQAISIHTQLADAGGVASDRLGLAAISIEESHPTEAEAPARAALEVFGKQKSLDDQVRALTLMARALIMEGKLNEAVAEIDQAKVLWEKSRDFNQHFDIGIVSARILAQTHDPAEAEKQLNVLLDEATRDGLVSYQFEVRLALGEIEMKAGNSASGVARLKSLERDASAKGFLLIAHKARAAADGAAKDKTG